MKRMEKYQIVPLCTACPESYSVHLGGEEVAEMRLRHGYFTAHVGSDCVYEATPNGDGIFDAEERDHYMHEAIRRIDAYLDPEGRFGALDPDEPVPEIERRFEPEL